MLKVELPLSIPVLIAGLRVVAVTNISMVSVGSVIGIGGLGTWFTEGYQADKSDQIVAGIIAIFLLAIVIDIAHPAGRPAHHAVGAGQGGVMNFLQQALAYIFTAANWGGKAGLGARILEHLQYTAVAVVVSALIAIPIGLLIGHTGRGTFLVVTGVNALRALPTLGVLLLGVLLWGLGLLPPTVALMLLGIPPLLAGTYAGIANVDPKVVDAARSMGMTETRVLTRVEVPNALPLILGGLRTATLQIVATATVAAYASLGGLGRYLIDGIKVRQFYLALVGCVAGDGAGAGARRLAGAGGVGVGSRHGPFPPDAATAARRRGGPGVRITYVTDGRTSGRLRTRRPVAYGRRVSAANDATESAWPAILTWRAHDVSRMESARVQLSGNRIKAYGRIVAAASGTHPAFSASYDLVTDDSGATKRLSLSVTLAERDRQLSIARDEENMWLITDHQGQSRGVLRGRARRRRRLQPVLQRAADPAHRPVPAGRFGHAAGGLRVPARPDGQPRPTISYSSSGLDSGDGIKLHSPVAETTITVDDDGFIVDYPGLAERI